MKAILFLLLSATMPMTAQIADQETAFLRTAGQWMASKEVSKRKAAYTTWLQMGPEAMPKYRAALDTARTHHEKALDTLCSGIRGTKNPYLDHIIIADELDAERERVIPLIRTDWKKAPKEIAMLRGEMQALADLHTRVQRAARANVDTFDAAINSHLDALVEIAREIERFEPDAQSASLDADELRERTVSNHLEASHLQELRKRFARTISADSDFEKAGEDNKQAGAWATGAMKSFAEILNGERAVLGLGPMRLEEKLSAAAEDHSRDMARLGFFAHESPVPKKKSPWDRARLAGFSGQASGENIYMGSGNPQAAYSAWFASDGHRFIMLASGPNVVGVGIAGTHWTMMTGRK